MNVREIAETAQQAAKGLRAAGQEDKNRALQSIKTALLKKKTEVFAANSRDLARNKKLATPLLKRLKFQDMTEVIAGIDALIQLPDPIGEVLEARELSRGLNLYRVCCPIGVIAMIFESRPDVAVQIASLALKSGNSILLKGGSEATETLQVLTRIIHDAALKADIPTGWLGHLTSRENVAEILGMDTLIDLIIPRGSNQFVRYIMDNSNIPVLGHADGICHLFIDEDADLNMAANLSLDAKVQYPAVCNALETLLVHEKIAPKALPLLVRKFRDASVELRACQKSRRIEPSLLLATEEDWSTEYLDKILSVKIVASLQEAMDHINHYGSGHTDGIVGSSANRARQFMDGLDTASVLWNCSTRFADGFRYGLGAEVGISTAKIHARGPVGMMGLTSYQWRLLGSGNCLANLARDKGFSHRNIDPQSYPFTSAK